MGDLDEQLRRSIRDLSSVGARIALVGGLAVSAQAEPRMTRDADFAIAVANDAEAEQLVLKMQQLRYQVFAIVEQEATGRLATVRLLNDDSVINLLFASCGIESEIVRDATLMKVLPGVTVNVASIGHLIAMKLLAREDRQRPNDADDLRALREVAQESDWSEAESAVLLIEGRGYARGRDLVLACAALRAIGPY